MKAVVLEVRDGVAAVLREDGTVEKVRRACEVGDTIEIDETGEKGRITQFPKRATRWVAAAVAAVVLVSGGTYGYNNVYAYSYVTLDANPSIEYVLNRRNEVLSVSALNEDAVSIVEELNAGGVRGADLSELLEETASLLYREEYLGSEEDDCLLISVTSRGDSQREALNAEIEEFNSRGDADIYVTNTTLEEGKSAKSLGLSTGRYKLMEDVIAAESGGPAEDVREFEEAPVTELLERSGRRPAPAREAETLPSPDGSAEPAQTAPQDGQTASGENMERAETLPASGEAGTEGGQVREGSAQSVQGAQQPEGQTAPEAGGTQAEMPTDEPETGTAPGPGFGGGTGQTGSPSGEPSR